MAKSRGLLLRICHHYHLTLFAQIILGRMTQGQHHLAMLCHHPLTLSFNLAQRAWPLSRRPGDLRILGEHIDSVGRIPVATLAENAR